MLHTVHIVSQDITVSLDGKPANEEDWKTMFFRARTNGDKAMTDYRLRFHRTFTIIISFECSSKKKIPSALQSCLESDAYKARLEELKIHETMPAIFFFTPTELQAVQDQERAKHQRYDQLQATDIARKERQQYNRKQPLDNSNQS